MLTRDWRDPLDRFCRISGRWHVDNFYNLGLAKLGNVRSRHFDLRCVHTCEKRISLSSGFNGMMHPPWLIARFIERRCATAKIENQECRDKRQHLVWQMVVQARSIQCTVELFYKIRSKVSFDSFLPSQIEKSKNKARTRTSKKRCQKWKRT